MKITPRDDGQYEVGGLTFSSEEAAKLFADSRSSKTRSAPVEGIVAPDWKKGASYVALAALMAYGVSSCFGPAKTPAEPFGSSESGALSVCQSALKAVSRDPETAEVPCVANQGSGSEFYFAWGISTKPVRMKNGFGALLSTGASCTVNKQTGKITGLTLDGKTVM